MHNKIRDLREDNDLSQEKMAKYLHINQATYSRYENELIPIPTDILIKLALFYQTSIDHLLGLTPERKPYPRKK